VIGAPLVARAPSLLRTDPTFRRFWIGQSASLVGDAVRFVALPLLGVLELGMGPQALGLLTSVGLLPNLLFALHAGAWVDRRGRRRATMIATDLASAMLLLAVAAAGLFGVLTRAGLYGASFLLGALGVVFGLASVSLFPTLVPREAYVAANQLVMGSRAVAGVAGPSVAGLIVQLATAPFALLVDACSFVVSAALLRTIAPVETPPAARAPGDIRVGMRFVVRSPVVRPTLAAIALTAAAVTGIHVLLVIYAIRSLHFSAGGLGAILSAGALGAVVGSLVAGRLVRARGIGATMTWSVAVMPVCLIAIPFAGGPTPLVVAILVMALFGSGAASVVFDIAASALLAAGIPVTIRARAQGAFMLVNYGVRPLGALLAGTLAGRLGVRMTLLTLALAGMGGVLVLLASRVPRLRTLDEIARLAEPDPAGAAG
jgi:MFS family permease